MELKLKHLNKLYSSGEIEDTSLEMLKRQLNAIGRQLKGEFYAK